MAVQLADADAAQEAHLRRELIPIKEAYESKKKEVRSAQKARTADLSAMAAEVTGEDADARKEFRELINDEPYKLFVVLGRDDDAKTLVKRAASLSGDPDRFNHKLLDRFRVLFPSIVTNVTATSSTVTAATGKWAQCFTATAWPPPGR